MGRRPVRSKWFLAAVVLVVAAGAGGGIALVLSGGGKAAPGENALDLHPVAGSFKPDGTRLADCGGSEQSCLEQAFGNVAFYDGPKAALRLFEEKMRTDPAVESGCHRIAHTIGSASLARFDGDVPEAFAQGSSACWSGYYHGILERAFLSVRTEPQLVAVARRVCSGAALRRSLWLTYQCVHGLGHGLMIESAYDLPFSLKVCDKLTSQWDRTSCTGGVFMENINAAGGTAYGGKTAWLKNGDLVYPCDSRVTAGHRLYCYLMVTSRILQANGYDWKETARICARVERAWVATCFQSYGRDADGFSRQNPAKVRALCRLAGRYENECVYGAARDMTANYSSGARASVLCRSVAAGLRSYCFYGIGTVLGTIYADSPGRRRACAGVTREYLAECLRGAGVAA